MEPKDEPLQQSATRPGLEGPRGHRTSAIPKPWLRCELLQQEPRTNAARPGLLPLQPLPYGPQTSPMLPLLPGTPIRDQKGGPASVSPSQNLAGRLLERV